MPIKADREYRALMQILKPNMVGKRINSDYYVDGYATKFNTPYLISEIENWKYYEIVAAGAFDNTDLRDVIFQYNHEGRVLSRVSNNTLGVIPDAIGLFTYSDLSKSNMARDIYSDIDNGLITKMSMGFKVLEDKWDYDYKNKIATRTIFKFKKLFDVSAVAMPANDQTEISVRALVQGSFDERQRETLEARRKRIEIKLLIGGNKL